MKERDSQLMLPEADFVREYCTLEFFKSSGAGGQHRNKTSSAVRVMHRFCDLRAEDCTERNQHRNRSKAVFKLKMLIALKFRNPPAETPPRMECSMNSPEYPLFVAKLFDILEHCGYDHKISAEKCGISSSALLKKIFKDPLLWQEFCRARTERDLPQLHL